MRPEHDAEKIPAVSRLGAGVDVLLQRLGWSRVWGLPV